MAEWQIFIYAVDSRVLEYRLPHHYSTQKNAEIDANKVTIPGKTYAICRPITQMYKYIEYNFSENLKSNHPTIK